mgnify:CR=1 FL=1
MRMILAATLALLPHVALAVGSDDSQPPTPTETTTKCEKGTVWDEKTKTCIKAEESSLNDDQRFGAVRELAYAGRYDEATAVLAAMREGETSRVMTYQGFLLRQTGRGPVGAVEASASGEATYFDAPIRIGSILIVFWGCVGFLVGVIIALQLAYPDLNLEPYFNFGRMRPLHTSAVVFAFGGTALITTSFYVVQRTCRTRLFSDSLAWFVFWGYQLFIVMAATGYLLGITEKVDAMRGGPKANEYSVRLELQADYLAGVWAYHANKMRDMLEKGDVEEAMICAKQIGDDTLQKRAQGYVVPDSFTHGTSEQRARWFTKGLKSGSLKGAEELFAIPYEDL